MKCFSCDKGKLESRRALVPGDVRGDCLAVECEALVCDRCGFQSLTDEQSDAYNLLITDAYREKHGLLTSDDLRRCREQLGMSQQQFAGFIGVGVASVKRWELGLIQDQALDQLIRLKTDLKAARENVKALQMRLGGRGERPGSDRLTR
jgi:putative zinc finger/helix-turn-helix YgiT family protein